MRISTGQIYERGTANMLKQQEKAVKLQEQLSSGLRVQNPSDDPVAAAQMELISQRLNVTKVLQNNNQIITNGLNHEDSILGAIATTIQSLQTIQIQSGNGILTQSDRMALGVAAKGLLDQLRQYANSTDLNGNYMFSGSLSNIEPISTTYAYNGDNTQRFQVASDTLQIAVNDTGDNLFMNIPAGNGDFAITQSGTNTGTSVASSGSVTNRTVFTANIPGNYSLDFALVGLQLEYTLTDINSGLPVLSNIPYVPGAAISFNGMEFSVDGTPASGDNYTIQTNQDESIFATVERMINNLNAPCSTGTEKAAIQNENNRILLQLKSGLENISKYQSDVGSRLNVLQSLADTNSNMDLLSQTVLTQLRDIDPTTVAVQYKLQLVNLDAAQQSFVSIQNLSVFNYL